MCFRLNSQVSLTGLPGLPRPRLRFPRTRQSPATLVRLLHDSRRQVRVRIVSLQMKQVAREMGHDGARLRRGQQAHGAAVPEESEIAVVRDDVDGATTRPRDLVGRYLAHANIADGADVAAVEADARPRAEHVFPRRVRRRDQGLGSGDAVGELRLCHAQRGCRHRRRCCCCFISWLAFMGPCVRNRPVVVHPRETKLGPERDGAPYALLRGNEVREGLADER